MSKTTSTSLEQMISDGTIVTFSQKQKKGKNIDDFINKTIGKEGSNQREKFESELKMEVFQELIKAARKKRNLSQDELGNLIGVKRAQISKIEKGYTNTSIMILSKVFEALHANVKISVEIDGQELILNR